MKDFQMHGSNSSDNDEQHNNNNTETNQTSDPNRNLSNLEKLNTGVNPLNISVHNNMSVPQMEKQNHNQLLSVPQNTQTELYQPNLLTETKVETNVVSSEPIPLPPNTNTEPQEEEQMTETNKGPIHHLEENMVIVHEVVTGEDGNDQPEECQVNNDDPVAEKNTQEVNNDDVNSNKDESVNENVKQPAECVLEYVKEEVNVEQVNKSEAEENNNENNEARNNCEEPDFAVNEENVEEDKNSENLEESEINIKGSNDQNLEDSNVKNSELNNQADSELHHESRFNKMKIRAIIVVIMKIKI